MIENKISESFKIFLSKEFDFYFLSTLLEELKNKNVVINESLRKKIDTKINNAAINESELTNSWYYFLFLGNFLEYYTRPVNIPLSSSVYFDNAVNISRKYFNGINEDLAYLISTRLHYISKPNLYAPISDSIRNFVFASIQSAEIKQALSKFFNAYTGINEEALNKVLFVNKHKKVLSFKEIIGKEQTTIVFIDFWASWCLPCLKQSLYIPDIQKKKSNIKIISISIDSEKEVWLNKIKNLNTKKSNQYLILDKIQLEKLTDIIKLTSIPRFMLLNKNGEIIFSNASRPENLNELLKEIELIEDADITK